MRSTSHNPQIYWISYQSGRLFLLPSQLRHCIEDFSEDAAVFVNGNVSDALPPKFRRNNSLPVMGSVTLACFAAMTALRLPLHFDYPADRIRCRVTLRSESIDEVLEASANVLRSVVDVFCAPGRLRG